MSVSRLLEPDFDIRIIGTRIAAHIPVVVNGSDVYDTFLTIDDFPSPKGGSLDILPRGDAPAVPLQAILGVVGGMIVPKLLEWSKSEVGQTILARKLREINGLYAN